LGQESYLLRGGSEIEGKEDGRGGKGREEKGGKGGEGEGLPSLYLTSGYGPQYCTLSPAPPR